LYVRGRLDARILGTTLEGATLRGADFSGWSISHVSFSKADLSGSTFDGVKAINANFSDANLENSRGKGGDFTEASFRGSKLRYSQFQDAKGMRLSKMARSDLYGSTLPTESEAVSAIRVVVELSRHAWTWVAALSMLWVTSALVVLSTANISLIAPAGLFH